MTVDLEEEEAGAVDGSVEVNMGDSEGGPIIEPYVGMEFESEEEAKKFYTEYARRVGFYVRVMQRRRGIDGRTLARRLGCNKQGFSPNHKGNLGPEKKARASAREGCNATILVKMEKSGKWVVTRFEKDHNHPLVVTANEFNTAVSFLSYLTTWIIFFLIHRSSFVIFKVIVSWSILLPNFVFPYQSFDDPTILKLNLMSLKIISYS